MAASRITPPRTEHRFALLLVPLMAAAVLFAACSSASAPVARPTASARAHFPLAMKDDDGVSATLTAEPARIVTWGPSLTETLYALGAGRDVVGVSGPFDDYPAAARSIPRVGGKSGVAPDVEKIVSLHPALVLNAFLGGGQWHEQLRTAGIPVFSLHATTFDDALHDIRTVGTLTGREGNADRLTARMLAEARSIQRKAGSARPVSCFLEEGFAAPSVYTIGPGSMEFDLLRRAGCSPVTAGVRSAYPAIDQESVVKDDPAVYLVATESGVGPSDVLRRSGVDAVAAVRDGRVFGISSDLLNRPGPRLVQALLRAAQLLHPSAFR
jgi:iron complex transport system substrate-binding protein